MQERLFRQNPSQEETAMPDPIPSDDEVRRAVIETNERQKRKEKSDSNGLIIIMVSLAIILLIACLRFFTGRNPVPWSN